jgi:gamma-glutamyl hydrolase
MAARLIAALLLVLTTVARAQDLLGEYGISTPQLTEKPIIGIMTHPSHHGKVAGSHMVAASYVKWVETGGGQAVPISSIGSKVYLDGMFARVNGLLFPGGGMTVNAQAKYMFANAVAANKRGVHFPVFGTCLGFQWMLQCVAGDAILQRGFDSYNITLPLHLTPAASTSRLLGGRWLRDIVADKAVTMNNHHSGIEPERFASSKALTDFFVVTSTNVDRKGRAFVSGMEAHDTKKMPIFGVQWHPEKNMFEWATAHDGTGRPYEVRSASRLARVTP